MTTVDPRASSPLGLIASFFIVAPAGLALAGFMLMRAGEDALLAPNTPELLSVTHACVLGWLSLSIMGALYQLGPVLFGGRLLSVKLARIQLLVHVAGAVTMVFAFGAWRLQNLAVGGTLVGASFAMFLVNAVPGVRAFRRGSLVRDYVSVALSFLVAAAALGITYAFALHYGWFPLTPGRVSAHAHLGLAGFLALTVMGLSYQLVPMFQVVPRGRPRFGRLSLWITVLGVIVFAAVLSEDPAAPIRLVASLGLAAGPGLWMLDQVGFIRRRAKRKMDVQGRATVVSLAFLASAIVVGLAAASGTWAVPSFEPARLELAYGILAIGGWAGTVLLGNSYKVVPFIVWNARFRELAGRQPVPTLADLLPSQLANATLWTHVVGISVAAVSAAAGSIDLLHLAGLVLSLGALLNIATQSIVLARRPARTATTPISSKGITT
jgi:hypothetical protein